MMVRHDRHIALARTLLVGLSITPPITYHFSMSLKTASEICANRKEMCSRRNGDCRVHGSKLPQWLHGAVREHLRYVAPNLEGRGY